MELAKELVMEWEQVLVAALVAALAEATATESAPATVRA
jgi:hypothetical protein